MKNEGIECLEGELLLVKLQNASCEGLHGKVCRFTLDSTCSIRLLLTNPVRYILSHI